jgi:hypothetical protein
VFNVRKKKLISTTECALTEWETLLNVSLLAGLRLCIFYLPASSSTPKVKANGNSQITTMANSSET